MKTADFVELAGGLMILLVVVLTAGVVYLIGPSLFEGVLLYIEQTTDIERGDGGELLAFLLSAAIILVPALYTALPGLLLLLQAEMANSLASIDKKTKQ